MLFIVATNIVASQLPKHRLTGKPTARTNMLITQLLIVIGINVAVLVHVVTNKQWKFGGGGVVFMSNTTNG